MTASMLHPAVAAPATVPACSCGAITLRLLSCIVDSGHAAALAVAEPNSNTWLAYLLCRSPQVYGRPGGAGAVRLFSINQGRSLLHFHLVHISLQKLTAQAVICRQACTSPFAGELLQSLALPSIMRLYCPTWTILAGLAALA